MAITAELKLAKDTAGSIVSAEARDARGAPLTLRVDKGAAERPVEGAKAAKAAYGTVKVAGSDGIVVQVTATVCLPKQTVGLEAKGEGLDLKWTIDFSNYEATNRGVMSGSLNGRPFTVQVDPHAMASAADLKSLNWLPAALDNQIKPLLPALQQMASDFDAKARPHKAVLDRALSKSTWSTVGHAACWGFASMGAAAGCVASAGAGCALAAGAFGAAASYCSDQY
jgi:hypothetical protein